MQLDDIRAANLEEVLELNQASVPHVSSLTMDALCWFRDHAHYFRIATRRGGLAGFLIGLRPGLDYASPNYGWFCENYSDFGYIDRVAVAANARRAGIASALYADFESTLSGQVDVMTCEVNIRPPNESSMQYHELHGFVRVGSQETEAGRKEVALMEKRL